MIKNLLRRFGYYKLNNEDIAALIAHYDPTVIKMRTKEQVLHMDYLDIDYLTALMYKSYPNPILVSYTCDQPDDVV